MRRVLPLIAISIPAFATPAQNRQQLATAALAQVGVTRVYDPSYVPLRYPGGDVPLERGVCADVIVRAFRNIGVDLQVALHEDMKTHFRQFLQYYGLHRPDANIDHRRVETRERPVPHRTRPERAGAGRAVSHR